MKSVEMSSQRRGGVRGFEVFSRTCAGIVGGVSLTVFAGWAFDLPTLRSIHPALVSMKVNSALGFALAALSLAVLSLRRHRPHGLLIARVAAAGVLLLGLATLLEHATGWNPGLDQMLFSEAPDAASTPHPGRMTVPTSALFVAGGCALLCLSSTRLRRTGHVLGMAVHLYGILAASVYFYDWRMLDSFGSFASMSIQSAFLSMVLGAAIATEGGPMLRLSRLEPHLGSLSLLLALCLLGLGVITIQANTDRLITINRAILASPGLQDSLSPPARQALAREEAAVEADTVRAQVALAFGAASAFLLIILGFVLMRREIGTRRRVEADHDRLFNFSLDMLAVAGFDGYFKDINPTWERTLGWSRHELMSVPYLKYVHPDDVEGTIQAAQGLSRGQPAVRFVNRYRCKDESYRWISWNSFPVPGEQLVFAVARDVTADRRSEEEILRLNRDLEQRVTERTAELAAANASLQGALAEVREAMARDTAARGQAEQEMRLNESRLESQLRLHQMVREDLGAIAHFAMEEAVRLTGSTLGYVAFMSPDETVLHMHAWSDAAMKLCRVKDKTILYPVATTGLWGEAVRQRRPVVTNEYEAPNPLKKGLPEGHVPLVRHMNVPVIDGGRIVVVAGVGNKATPYDETDVRQLTLLMTSLWNLAQRKRADEELRALNAELERRIHERTEGLEAANRELEAFSYSVSHDLRAPLRHVTGFAEMLLKHTNGSLDGKAEHFVRTIHAAALKMGRLIDDLLVFSRMGRVVLTHSPVNLRLLLDDAIRESAPESRGRNVAWDIGPLPVVQGDPSVLRQVFANLVGNALKYTRPRAEARIAVSSRREGGEHVVCIRDNGVGFDMKYVDKLFGVFQRLHSEAEFEGTGIGLANVRRIIQRHGGRTWAEGTPGAGAAFYFSLPATPEKSEDDHE